MQKWTKSVNFTLGQKKKLSYFFVRTKAITTQNWFCHFSILTQSNSGTFYSDTESNSNTKRFWHKMALTQNNLTYLCSDIKVVILTQKSPSNQWLDKPEVSVPFPLSSFPLHPRCLLQLLQLLLLVTPRAGLRMWCRWSEVWQVQRRKEPGVDLERKVKKIKFFFKL